MDEYTMRTYIEDLLEERANLLQTIERLRAEVTRLERLAANG